MRSNCFKKIFISGIVFMLTTANVSGAQKGIVKANILNVRTGPSLKNKVISKVYLGQQVQILGQKNNWYKIQIKQNKLAYVYKDYIDITNIKQKKSSLKLMKSAKSTNNKVAIVNVAVLNVRQAPSLSANIIGKTYINNELSVNKVHNDWVEVIRTDGSKAYLYKEYVTIKEKSNEGNNSTRQQIIDYAKQFIGNPYTYGGNSLTNGIDCSGFTQQILGKFGYTLGRSSRSQINNGTHIDKNDLLPGDLVFYGYSGNISHVALYAGDDKIIHASTPKTGIIIDNLYYGQPYIGASRIIND